ncbi:hypothetical protein OROGR_023531 [Orobanche gracilis]
MRAALCVIFYICLLLPHVTVANRSNTMKAAIVATYAPGSVKQYEREVPTGSNRRHNNFTVKGAVPPPVQGSPAPPPVKHEKKTK